eukprot:TRINITY_DN4351_c0_g1_i2.p1 TRINITY_DN4351_c0_g1~~TRINITY_DN4351_c0_g1_i2.p1  ORF type:complete len:670 (+),score=245.56 TRINITY_DN4351_c0_g1_i2:715-2724(+)
MAMNANGYLVYHMAAVGIVYDTQTQTQKFFFGHDDDIISLAMHPDKDIIATGQVASIKDKKPKICIWSSKTLELLAVLEGFHTRGVSCLGFSKDGNFLGTVGQDDKHSIAVYDWKKKSLVASSPGNNNETVCLRWSSMEPTSFATCGKNHVKFWTLSGKTLTGKDGIFRKSKTQTILCMLWTKTKGELLTGCYDGSIYQWVNGEVVNAFKAHQYMVYYLENSSKGFLSGGKDGINFWSNYKTPTVKPDSSVSTDGHCVRTMVYREKENLIFVGTKDNDIIQINSGKVSQIVGGHFNELWALATHPNQSIFATGGKDHTVRLWDCGKKQQLSGTSLGEEKSASSLAFSPDGKILAVGTETGEIIFLETEGLKEVKTLKERKDKIDDLKFSPDGKFLAAGTHAGLIDIYFQVENWKLIGTCKGHTSWISHLDWSADSKVIQSDSGDYEHIFWDIEDTSQITKSTITRDIKWDTWTCVLGWPVKGIWPPGSDGTDVNAGSTSRDKKYFATADDFGTLKIFKYPVDMKAEARVLSGHSSHVTNVRWTVNDTHVITTGGNDRSVMQWTTNGSGNVVQGTFKESPMKKMMSLPRTPRSPSSLGTPRDTPRDTPRSNLNFEEVLGKLGNLSGEESTQVSNILKDTRKENIQRLLIEFSESPDKAEEVAAQIKALLS